MQIDPPTPARNERLYTAFGLCIHSCLPLPELAPAQSGQSIDVEIAYGSLPERLPNATASGVRYQTAPGALLLSVDGVARFLVSDGRTIGIERHPEADDDDVRVFLLGSALGALLHQRGDLALHGSAIDFGGIAVTFVGPSGIGKSTLASALRQRGHAMLSDDLCVLRPNSDGMMLAYPGFPQAKLWLDSLAQLEIDTDGLRRIRRKLEKRAIPLHEGFAAKPAPLRSVYLLHVTHGSEIVFTPLEGAAKFSALKENTFRFGFVADMESKAAHFASASRLAQQARLTVVERPREPFLLDELVARIEADLRT